MDKNIFNFWKKKINLIKWKKKPNKIFEWKNNNHPHWFKDGTTNITYNCLAMKKFDKKKDDLSTLLNPNSVYILLEIFKGKYLSGNK